MNIKKYMIGTLLFLSMNAFAAIHHVDCDAAANDSLAIQNAINGAVEGDTVKIHGTCYLTDKTIRIAVNKSYLTIEGDAYDNNTDGKMDQWDTKLIGLGGSQVAVGGTDFVENFIGPWSDLGLGLYIGKVPATDENIIGVTIQNLEFKEFYIALSVSPGVLANNLLCDQIQTTKAKAINTVVQQNNFVDNSVHFLVWGGADNTLFDTNRVEGGGGVLALAAVMSLGRVNLCLSNIFPDSIDIGMTLNTKYVNNYFENVGRLDNTGDFNFRAVEAVNSKNDLIKGNTFVGNGEPVELFGSINSRVEDNVLINSYVRGIGLVNSQNAVVTKNIIKDIVGFNDGIYVTSFPPDGFWAPFEWTLNRNSQISCNHVEGAVHGAHALGLDTEASIRNNRYVNNDTDIVFDNSTNFAIVGPLDTVNDVPGDNMVVRVDNQNDCAPMP